MTASCIRFCNPHGLGMDPRPQGWAPCPPAAPYDLIYKAATQAQQLVRMLHAHDNGWLHDCSGQAAKRRSCPMGPAFGLLAFHHTTVLQASTPGDRRDVRCQTSLKRARRQAKGLTHPRDSKLWHRLFQPDECVSLSDSHMSGVFGKASSTNTDSCISCTCVQVWVSNQQGSIPHAPQTN